MTRYRPTRAEIDLEALRSNFRALRALSPSSSFACPMVKANAYGHGDVECARAFREAGAGWLGVALFEEAFRLREAGDEGAVLVFGPADSAAAREAFAQGVSPVVGSLDQLRLIAAAAEEQARTKAGRRMRVHLEFNTGMNRLGLDPSEARAARSVLEGASRALELEGVCTHLARGEDAGDAGGASEEQLARFGEALAAFSGTRFLAHALNSSGLANAAAARRLDRMRAELGIAEPLGLRPGVAAYGAYPDHDRRSEVPLKPVMALKSAFTQFHRLRPGARVSYGGRWEAKRESLIGVLPVGYGDGYFRALSSKASVLVRGLRAPVTGSVCMDYMMADLTDVERETGPIPLGEEATLLGRAAGAAGAAEIRAGELAEAIGTISYEIFTSIGARVPRVFLNERADSKPG